MVAGSGGAVAWGSPKKKLGAEGLEGWPGRRRTTGGELFQGGEAVRECRWPRAAGAAVWPVVASGSGGWRLKMNYMPLISYPTNAKSSDQR